MILKKSLKKIFVIAITVLFLHLIYSKIDLKDLKNNLLNLNTTYLFWAFSLFFVLPLIKTYRWKIIIGKELNSSYFSVLKVVMAGTVFNLFLPSKLGDFSRIIFSQKELSINKRRIFNSVIAEKICDVMALCVVSLVSLIFIDVDYSIKIIILIFSLILFFSFFIILYLDFHKFKLFELILNKFSKLKEVIDDARSLKKEVKYNNISFIKIFCVSIFYWYIVLFQIYLFFLMLNAKISILVVIVLVPIALFIGMIPITISGMGTRDAALIFLFSKYYPPEIMAGIGILCSLRYLVGSMIGLPFFLLHNFSKQKKVV